MTRITTSHNEFAKMKSKPIATSTVLISLIAVAAEATQVLAMLVTGTFSGATSQSQLFLVNGSGNYTFQGSPTQTGAFSGTFQFDTTGAVDTDPNPNVAAYSLAGTITGFGGTSTAALTLTSNVGVGVDTFNLSDSVPGFNFILNLSSLPAGTYSPGDFVPEIPLNLTGLTGATFTRNERPPLPQSPGTTGQIRTGNIENFTLSVASIPESSPIYLAPLVAAAWWWRSRRMPR
jgi:hypothetical protein